LASANHSGDAWCFDSDSQEASYGSGSGVVVQEIANKTIATETIKNLAVCLGIRVDFMMYWSGGVNYWKMKIAL
jgi:hypothetical protein